MIDDLLFFRYTHRGTINVLLLLLHDSVVNVAMCVPANART